MIRRHPSGWRRRFGCDASPRADAVFVCKRGQGTGYSGIENPLFYKEDTRMLYGNARESIG